MRTLFFVPALALMALGCARPAATATPTTRPAPATISEPTATPTRPFTPTPTAPPTPTSSSTSTLADPTEVARKLSLSPVPIGGEGQEGQPSSTDDTDQLETLAPLRFSPEDITTGWATLDHDVHLGPSQVIKTGSQVMAARDKSGRMIGLIDPETNLWQRVGAARASIMPTGDGYTLFGWWNGVPPTGPVTGPIERGLVPIGFYDSQEKALKAADKLIDLLNQGGWVDYDPTTGNWVVYDKDGRVVEFAAAATSTNPLEKAQIYGDLEALSDAEIANLEQFMAQNLMERGVNLSDADRLSIKVDQLDYLPKERPQLQWDITVYVGRDQYRFLRVVTDNGERLIAFPTAAEIPGAKYYQEMYGGQQKKPQVYVEYSPLGFFRLVVGNVLRRDGSIGTMYAASVTLDELLDNPQLSLTEALTPPTAYMDRLAEYPVEWQAIIRESVKYGDNEVIIVPWVMKNHLGLRVFSSRLSDDGSYRMGFQGAKELYYIKDPKTGEWRPNIEHWAEAMGWAFIKKGQHDPELLSDPSIINEFADVMDVTMQSDSRLHTFMIRTHLFRIILDSNLDPGTVATTDAYTLNLKYPAYKELNPQNPTDWLTAIGPFDVEAWLRLRASIDRFDITSDAKANLAGRKILYELLVRNSDTLPKSFKDAYKADLMDYQNEDIYTWHQETLGKKTVDKIVEMVDTWWQAYQAGVPRESFIDQHPEYPLSDIETMYNMADILHQINLEEGVDDGIQRPGESK